MCVPVRIIVKVCRYLNKLGEGLGSPGTGVTDINEPPDVGTENLGLP